jgi:hypothetical protein
MFAYNPNLRNEKAVNVNPSADVQNVNKSLSGVIDVLSEAQKQRNTEASALAKIKAAKIDNNNKVVAAKVQQTYMAENLRTQFKNASKLSTQKWGQDTEVAKVLNVNKVKAEALKVETDKDLQNTISNNALFRQDLQNEEARKIAKTKADTDIAIAKIKNVGKAKVSSADKNILIKEVNEDGGIDNLITKAIDSIDDDNFFFDFDLDEASIRDLKYSIQAMIMENPNEGMKYRLNRKEYVKEFMKEYGETDNSYLPFTNDKWVPNTDAMLIKKKMNDIKRLKGE